MGLYPPQWGDIHFWISLGLLVVLVIHLVLHWNWIVTVIGKRCHLVKPRILHWYQVVLDNCYSCPCNDALCLDCAVALKNSPANARQTLGANTRQHIESLAPLEAQVQSGLGQAQVVFWKDVYPVFENNCLSCHGPQKQLANFRVDRREDFFGSKDRPPLVIPGQSSISPLIAIVSGTKKDMPMADRHKLSGQDVELLKVWIDSGAEWTVTTDTKK